jgi:hypothetical protein
MMYKGPRAIMAERLLARIGEIERQLFEKIEGLRQLCDHLPPATRNELIHAHLDEPAKGQWWALSVLLRQVSGPMCSGPRSKRRAPSCPPATGQCSRRGTGSLTRAGRA